MSNSAKPVYTDEEMEKIREMWDATVDVRMPRALPHKNHYKFNVGTPDPPKCECGKLIAAEGGRIDRARDILRVIVEAADSGSAERLPVSINAARALLRK